MYLLWESVGLLLPLMLATLIRPHLPRLGGFSTRSTRLGLFSTSKFSTRLGLFSARLGRFSTLIRPHLPLFDDTMFEAHMTRCVADFESSLGLVSCWNNVYDARICFAEHSVT